MKSKEIIEKLKDIICEAENKEEEERRGEFKQRDESWFVSYWSATEIKEKFTLLFVSNKYVYYTDLRCHLIYRIKE